LDPTRLALINRSTCDISILQTAMCTIIMSQKFVNSMFLVFSQNFNWCISYSNDCARIGNFLQASVRISAFVSLIKFLKTGNKRFSTLSKNKSYFFLHKLFYFSYTCECNRRDNLAKMIANRSRTYEPCKIRQKIKSSN